MFKWLGGRGDSNERQIQRLRPAVDEINEFEVEFSRLSADELKAKTKKFKNYLVEAISPLEKAVKLTLQQLEVTRARLNTTDEGESQEIDSLIKRTEERVSRLEQDQRDTEKEALDEILPEAFAAVREAARRTIARRHFDVQLMGGMVLHQGKIAEMKAGEGKTLAAALPLYLNSLLGRGCHLVKANDYFSKSDVHWMGPVYAALGVTVGAIHSQTADNQSPSFVYDDTFESADKAFLHLRPVSRKDAYHADITYGTSNEFGFDYLRDNMVMDLEQCVQRPLSFAIVDEVDNLLIDQARTPLIISGPAPNDDSELYSQVDSVVGRMKPKVLPHELVSTKEKKEEGALGEAYDYLAYENTHSITSTRAGQETLARAFRLSVDDLFGGWGKGVTPQEARRRNRIVSVFHTSLLAHAWYRRDREYVVKDNEVILVDEFTGQLALGRRYSGGLHQAIEAMEHVKVQRENLTYATIDFQSYFRMYRRLAGMTGTAQTEAEEFHKIHKLEVLAIPPNRPIVRRDFPDRIYKDEKSKFNAVVKEVVEFNAEKRPVLIGTVSIERSEMLSELLKRKGILVKVLNAKPENAQREAAIVAEAGRLKSVTVATNMAGRGVDVILGGNPEAAGRAQADWQREHDEVVALGGLHIIGTERHEARRIDNKLCDIAGGDGDPGSSRFYLSLDDNVMKRFGGDKIRGLMQMAGMDEGRSIENKTVNETVEAGQVKAEALRFEMRQRLLEFDEVIGRHRELIYAERRKALDGSNLKSSIASMVRDEIHNAIVSHGGDQSRHEWDLKGTLADANMMFPLSPEFGDSSLASVSPEDVEERLVTRAEEVYEQKERESGSASMRMVEKLVVLRAIDSLWIEHLTLMNDKLIEAGFYHQSSSVNWAPLQKAIDAYRNLGHEQWELLMSNIRHQVAHTIYHIAVVR